MKSARDVAWVMDQAERGTPAGSVAGRAVC